ncbi:MAG: hypothetical protein AAB972_01525, partial [Patescibacteria group bacterium]
IPTDNSVKIENDYEKYNALYPVFSEQVIDHACKRVSKYWNELCSKHEKLRQLEHAEARKHHQAGMDASTFDPSLSWLLQEINFTAVNKNDAEKDLKNKIETNIRALNGMSIEQAEKEYEDHHICTSNEEIEKLGKDFIKGRRESWHKQWKYLINEEKDVDKDDS